MREFVEIVARGRDFLLEAGDAVVKGASPDALPDAALQPYRLKRRAGAGSQADAASGRISRALRPYKWSDRCRLVRRIDCWQPSIPRLLYRPWL